MGRKQKFDRQEAIEAAKSLFWQRGYVATSIRDLANVLNMKSGSLYKAFGSKEGLFGEVLDSYGVQNSELFKQCLAAEYSPIKGYRLFLERIALVNRPCKTCMMARAAAAMNIPKPTTEQAQVWMRQFEGQIVEWLEVLKLKQQLRPDAQTLHLAHWLQSQIIGIRILADSGIDRRCMEETIDLQIKAIAYWFVRDHHASSKESSKNKLND